MNEYTITEIRSNSSLFLQSLSDGDIDGNNIVWSELISGDGDFEIFLYNGSETIQLTDNDVNDFFPKISGDNIVWQSQINEDSEIFLYDGSEAEIIQITDNAIRDTNPAISGSNVVWSQSGEIVLYNGSETIQLTDNDVRDTSPAISGNNVVWKSEIDTDGEIFLYDGNETIQLTDNNVVESFEVSGNNVLISSRRNNNIDSRDIDIFLYNGSETIQLNNNSLANNDLETSDDNVVWTEDDGNDSEIFLFDGSQTIQLTDNDVDDFASRAILSGDNVVWTGSDGNDLEVFLFDGSQTIQLTNNDIDERFVEISGDNIVWQQDNISESGEGPRSIFVATPNNIENVDSVSETDTVYRFLNNDTGVHFYTANETERDAVEDLDNYTFEGASYQGIDPLTGADDSLPVYRFLNQDTGVHLYTISETERDATEELSNFSFEGEAFSAYASEVEGSIPIYRFFNSVTGAHFYTPSATERDAVVELADYESEGIAYYALSIETEVI